MDPAMASTASIETVRMWRRRSSRSRVVESSREIVWTALICRFRASRSSAELRAGGFCGLALLGICERTDDFGGLLVQNYTIVVRRARANFRITHASDYHHRPRLCQSQSDAGRSQPPAGRIPRNRDHPAERLPGGYGNHFGLP